LFTEDGEWKVSESMKITFDDKSHVEIRKSDKPDHILIVVSAKDAENPRKKITNAVEITTEEFKKLVSDVL
jgi:hypothetical protein